MNCKTNVDDFAFQMKTGVCVCFFHAHAFFPSDMCYGEALNLTVFFPYVFFTLLHFISIVDCFFFIGPTHFLWSYSLIVRVVGNCHEYVYMVKWRGKKRVFKAMQYAQENCVNGVCNVWKKIHLDVYVDHMRGMRMI